MREGTGYEGVREVWRLGEAVGGRERTTAEKSRIRHLTASGGA